jgi:hypothetical protein
VKAVVVPHMKDLQKNNKNRKNLQESKEETSFKMGIMARWTVNFRN